MVFRRKDELSDQASSSERLLASSSSTSKRSMFGRTRSMRKERSDDIGAEGSSNKSFRLFSRQSKSSTSAVKIVKGQERSFHEEMDKMSHLTPPVPAATTPNKKNNDKAATPLSVSVITTTRSDGLSYNKASDDVSTLTDLSAAGAAANKRLLAQDLGTKSKGSPVSRKKKEDTTKTKESASTAIVKKTPRMSGKKSSSKPVDASTPETQPEEDDTYTASYTQGTYGETIVTNVTSPSITTRVVETCHFSGLLSSFDHFCFTEQHDDATTTATTTATPTNKRPGQRGRRSIQEEASTMSQSKTTTTEWGTVPSESNDEEEGLSLDTAESDTLFKDLTTTTTSKKSRVASSSFEDKHENFELVLDEYQLEQAKAAAAAAAAGDDTSGPNLRSKVRNWMRKREDDKRTMEKEARQEKYRAIFGTDPASVTKVETTTNTGEVIGQTSATAAAVSVMTTSGSDPETKNRSGVESSSSRQMRNGIMSPETITSEGAVMEGQYNQQGTQGEENDNPLQDELQPRRVTSSTWEQRKIELERKLTSPTTVPSSAYASEGPELRSDTSSSKFEMDAAQASKKSSSSKSKKSSYKPTWKAAKDPKSGRYYYYHRLTRTTTWSKPGGYDQEQAKIAAMMQEEQQLDGSNRSSASKKLGRALSFTKRNKGSMSAEQQKRMDAGESTNGLATAAPKILKRPSRSAPKSGGGVPNKKKQQEISNILRTMSPPNESAITSLMQQYQGREDELLNQLKTMKVEEAKHRQRKNVLQRAASPSQGIVLEANGDPFDEPNEQREAPPPVFSMLDTAMSSFGVLPASAVMGPGIIISGSSRTVSPSPSDAASLARTRTGVTIKTEKTERTDKTDKTAKVDNTRKGNENPHNNKSFDAVTEPSAADTSISSVEMIDRYEFRVSPQRRTGEEAERTRELRVEEFSSKHDSIASEKYAGKILRPSQRAAQRRQQEQQRKLREREEAAAAKKKKELLMEQQQKQQQQQQQQTQMAALHQSDASDRGYMISSEEDEMTGAETGNEGDDISALSDADMEYFEQKERLDSANRKALNIAIRNKDWDTAASVTNTLRTHPLLEGAQPTRDSHAFVETPIREWTQSDLDGCLARSDWNAVAKYIAVMKESGTKKQAQRQTKQQAAVPRPRSNGIVQPPFIHRGRQVAANGRVHSSVASAARNNPRFKKRFGARSQLQRDLESVQSSSWESESSYDDEDEELWDDDESSEEESTDLRRFARSRSRLSKSSSSRRSSSSRQRRKQQKFQC